jgi:signal transduction histidine kinase
VAFDVFGFQTSPGAMALLFSDVTGRKRMEAARLEMRAREQQVKLVETQSKLVQGLAHEIRNPLFAIQANVAAALKRMGEGGDPEPFVGHVSDQVRRLDTLMRDLMVLGRRPSEDKVESLDLADLVRQAAEAAEGVRPGEEGRIAVEAPLHAVAVRGDRGQLTLAFLHILENALAFAPPKSGSVWVSVGEERGRPVVRVVDRGPGILPGLLSSLFEPFVTGRTGHTGLGLTLARHYLESCGAEVRAENNDPGPGAAVIVTFPAEARG